jgi:hypothetical protein
VLSEWLQAQGWQALDQLSFVQASVMALATEVVYWIENEDQ